MSYNTFTLTGTYKKPSGVADKGGVVVIPSVSPLVDNVGNVILAGAVSADLDTNGSFSLVLPTTGANLLPATFGYTLIAHLNGSGRQADITLTPGASGTTLNVAQITPAPLPAVVTPTAVTQAGLDGSVAALVNDVASGARGALTDAYAAQVDPSTTNKRILSRYQPVFDSSFVYSKISSVQDGLLVWSGLNVSAGAATPTYFKAVGGSITHSGPGNLDVFWASVTHTGPREAGLFIGDITSSGGGNNYGMHTRNTQTTLAPANILVGYECELVPNVARGSAQYYNILIQNSGSQPVSAGIQIESPAGGGGGKFDKGLNFDSSAASGSATAIFLGEPAEPWPATGACGAQAWT